MAMQGKVVSQLTSLSSNSSLKSPKVKSKVGKSEIGPAVSDYVLVIKLRLVNKFPFSTLGIGLKIDA